VSIRRNAPPVVVSAAEHADQTAVFRAKIDAIPGQRSGAIPEVPRTKPPIRRVVVGQDGRYWVHVNQPSERFEPPPVAAQQGRAPAPVLKWRDPLTAAYEVFEPAGTYLGRVMFPASATPVLMRGDEVWCSFRNEDDVISLRKYRVRWQ
jgi:hypothetical protein